MHQAVLNGAPRIMRRAIRLHSRMRTVAALRIIEPTALGRAFRFRAWLRSRRKLAGGVARRAPYRSPWPSLSHRARAATRPAHGRPKRNANRRGAECQLDDTGRRLKDTCSQATALSSSRCPALRLPCAARFRAAIGSIAVHQPGLHHDHMARRTVPRSRPARRVS
jgi:hypothetical protein